MTSGARGPPRPMGTITTPERSAPPSLAPCSPARCSWIVRAMKPLRAVLPTRFAVPMMDSEGFVARESSLGGEKRKSDPSYETSSASAWLISRNLSRYPTTGSSLTSTTTRGRYSPITSARAAAAAASERTLPASAGSRSTKCTGNPYNSRAVAAGSCPRIFSVPPRKSAARKW